MQSGAALLSAQLHQLGQALLSFNALYGSSAQTATTHNPTAARAVQAKEIGSVPHLQAAVQQQTLPNSQQVAESNPLVRVTPTEAIAMWLMKNGGQV